MRAEIDRTRAREVLIRLNSAFSHREGILSDLGDLVENQIPTGVQVGSEDHARFLFYTVFNDHGMKSTRLYKRAKDLFLEKPEVFEPLYVTNKYSNEREHDLEEEITKSLGVRYPRQAAKSWYANSQRILNQYDGQVRKLFQHSNDARSLLNAITVFRGYGPKTGGMLLRAIVGLGFTELNGLDRVLVPVDIHDSRIAFYTQILSIDANDELESIDFYDFAKQVQEILLETSNDLEVPWLNADRALWIIGSKGCVKRRCHECPLSDLCLIGKKVVFGTGYH
jgi:endonuclease III